MNLPPEAVQAAHAEARTWCTDLAADTGSDPSLLRQMICAPGGMITSVLEAAWPYLAADVLTRIEQGLTDGAREAITQAVTAERERCAQLAHEHRAVCYTGNMIDGIESRPFADLLRAQP